MAAWLTHLIILMMFAVSWHLHFILYLPFLPELTDWLTDEQNRLSRCFFWLIAQQTHTTSTATTTTSHISFHFHIHYCFRRATQVSFSSFFTFTTDGKLSTVNLCACVYVCVSVCVATSVFVVSYCSRAPEKQMMTLTAVKLSLFDFIIINSGQASLIIE